MSARTFPYPEADLAVLIGMPRGEMRVLRDRVLSKKEWAEGDAGVVMISRKGFEKIAAEIGLADSEKIAALMMTVQPAQPVNGNGLVKLRVTQIPVNQMLVLCSDEAGARYSVDVGRNENFLRGMDLQARPHPVHQGLYKLEGPRPRQKGRW